MRSIGRSTCTILHVSTDALRHRLDKRHQPGNAPYDVQHFSRMTGFTRRRWPIEECLAPIPRERTRQLPRLPRCASRSKRQTRQIREFTNDYCCLVCLFALVENEAQRGTARQRALRGVWIPGRARFRDAQRSTRSTRRASSVDALHFELRPRVRGRVQQCNGCNRCTPDR